MKTALDRPSCVHMGYRQYHLHFVAPIHHLDTRGNPRTPCPGTEGRSAAAARLTALSYRNQSTVRRRRTDFGYRTVHEATDKAKPSFRLFHADRMRRA